MVETSEKQHPESWHFYNIEVKSPATFARAMPVSHGGYFDFFFSSFFFFFHLFFFVFFFFFFFFFLSTLSH